MSTYAFGTLREDGLLSGTIKKTPMTVTNTLTNHKILTADCGGYQIGNTLYLNSVGGCPIVPLS